MMMEVGDQNYVEILQFSLQISNVDKMFVMHKEFF